MLTIDSQADWDWYKKRLDVDAKYEHRHEGVPEKFPCKVESTWCDDPNGPYYYRHRFFYQEEKKCPSCGHIHLEWKLK